MSYLIGEYSSLSHSCKILEYHLKNHLDRLTIWYTLWVCTSTYLGICRWKLGQWQKSYGIDTRRLLSIVTLLICFAMPIITSCAITLLIMRKRNLRNNKVEHVSGVTMTHHNDRQGETERHHSAMSKGFAVTDTLPLSMSSGLGLTIL